FCWVSCARAGADVSAVSRSAARAGPNHVVFRFIVVYLRGEHREQGRDRGASGRTARPQVPVELDRSGAPAPEAARPCGAVTLRGCLAAGGGVSRLWNNTRERPVLLHSSAGPGVRANALRSTGAVRAGARSAGDPDALLRPARVRVINTNV